MKKTIGIILSVVFIWLMGVELIFNNTGVRMLTDKAKTMPIIMTVENISKLIVLDSIPKTGMISRYNYTKEQLKKLFEKNEFTIQDNDYTYFYCYEGRANTRPKASMLTAALHKENKEVIARGTGIFLEKIPDIEQLSREQRNAGMLASVFQIQRKKGACFQIQ